LLFFALVLGVAFSVFPLKLTAMEVSTQSGASIPCAILSDWSGDVQILDETRSHLVDLNAERGIPCGSWISTRKGWAKLQHRDGYVIQVGSKSFVSLPDPGTEGSEPKDHMVVYEGQVYVQAESDEGEFRIVSANSRARIKESTSIFLYNHEDEESELISLKGQSILENRFEARAATTVKEGEATSLNLKQTRVVPTEARPVALASLRAKLGELHLAERAQSLAMHTAKKRLDRKILGASVPKGPVRAGKPPKAEMGGRKIASLETPEVASAVDESAPVTESAPGGNSPSDHHAERVIGSTLPGDRSLYHPAVARHSSSHKAGKNAKVHDASDSPVNEKKEKQKLMEEISEIHDDSV
jgi:hypothetical protein